MAKRKWVKFKVCDGGGEAIMGRGGCIGFLLRAGSGTVFPRRAVMSMVDSDTEFTSECLRQIADELDRIEGLSKRPTGTQHAQHARLCRHYGECTAQRPCRGVVLCESDHKCQWQS